jgi:hypothetical protein
MLMQKQEQAGQYARPGMPGGKNPGQGGQQNKLTQKQRRPVRI